MKEQIVPEMNFAQRSGDGASPEEAFGETAVSELLA
jgi:hypothetical protein